jgi:tRNA1Val (adenine37-N6)-methyltransferase
MDRSFAFDFQQFSIQQDQCAMKIGIDGVLLGAWSPIVKSKHILDIGTGTGLLALMMAQRSDAAIDAVEIDNAAFLQAQDNIQNSSFHDRIQCYHSSIQEFKTQKSYDLIISNPPYFEASLKSDNKARNSARHNDGLNLSELFSKASQLLSPQGHLAIILPYSSLGKIKIRTKEQKLHLAHITEVKGREHKSPNRVLVYLQRDEIETSVDTLTIYSSEGGYTKAFQNLTQDYYLPSIFR